MIYHPLNDMMRNYNISGEQAAVHIKVLLNSLGLIKRYIFYLNTENVSGQIEKACYKRRQSVPTDEQIEFWEKRYKNDLIVLKGIKDDYKIYDISCGDYDLIRKNIICKLTSNYITQ